MKTLVCLFLFNSIIEFNISFTFDESKRKGLELFLKLKDEINN